MEKQIREVIECSTDNKVVKFIEHKVTEYNKETTNILNRFGRELTQRQIDIFKAERNMDLIPTIQRGLEYIWGDFVSYDVQHENWVEIDVRIRQWTFLNKYGCPIKRIRVKERLYE